MSNVNKAILVGHLGKDPEIKYIPNGQAVVSFSLATSKRLKDKQSGGDKEITNWHNIKCWGKTGELCHQYLKKGSLVYIEGEIQTRSYESKTGEKRYVTEINARNITFLGKSNVGQAPNALPKVDDNASWGGTDYGPSSKHEEQTYTTDDIPF